MIWILASILLVLPVLVFLLLKFIDGGQNYWKKRGVFSVNNSDLIPLLDRLLFKVPFHIVDKTYYDCFKSSGVGARFAGQVALRHPVLFVMDPDLIRSMLVKDFDHFLNRKAFDFGISDKMFDQMLINKENQEWKDLRTTMSPTFTTGKIRRMFGIFNESGNKMVEFLKAEMQNSCEIEMRDVCGRFTMDVIASSAFGVDSQNFKDKNSTFSQMGRLFQDNFKGLVIFKIVILILFPKIFRVIKFSFFDQRCIEFFTKILKESIQHREESGEKREDFLQLMLEAKAGNLKMEKGDVLDKFEQDAVLTENKNEKRIKEPITDDLILAQATLFFLAGFDVMETLLMFAAYEMAVNENYQEHLFKEIDEAIENNGGKLTYDIVSQLEYLDKFVSETLRKYPAAGRSERRCNLDYKIPNSEVTVTKGTHVVVPIYGIHHDADLYPEPERFDPERFSAENKASRHSCAYIPFGVGPRNCIAMRFAIMEGKTAVAHLVHNFKISPCSKTSIPMKYSTKGILKPENGMWLSLTPRK